VFLEVKTVGERKATLGNGPDGNPVGATIFLSPDQLRRLGVDPENEAMSYRVDDGIIVLEDL
jgi:hypothetical protein